MEDIEALKKRKKKFLILAIAFFLIAMLTIPVSCIIIFMTMPGDEVLDSIADIDMIVIFLSVFFAIVFFVLYIVVNSQIKNVKGNEARMVYANKPDQTVQSNTFAQGETPHCYCCNCGQHIDMSASFCPFCGHKIEPEEDNLTLIEKVHGTGCLGYWSVFLVNLRISIVSFIIGFVLSAGLFVYGFLLLYLYQKSSGIFCMTSGVIVTGLWIFSYLGLPAIQQKSLNATSKANSDVYVYQDKILATLTPQLQARYGNALLKVPFNDVKKVFVFKDSYCFFTKPLMGVRHLVFIEKKNIKNTATKQFLDRKRDEINARKRG